MAKKQRDQWNPNDISPGGQHILTLLQSVDEPDPGPKILDKETIFDVSASKLGGKEVQNTDNLSSNPKENIPIRGYKIIDADIFQEIFSFCSKCVYCGGEKCLCILQQDKSRRGLPEKVAMCPMCTM